MTERPVKTRGRYSDEVKAACLAALDSGQSLQQVFQATGVPTATLSFWRGKGDAFVAPVRAKISRDLADMYERIVRRALGRLAKSAMLDTATAPQLAVIAGIGTDKLMALRSKPLPAPVREVFAGIDLASLSDGALSRIQAILAEEGVKLKRAVSDIHVPDAAQSEPAGHESQQVPDAHPAIAHPASERDTSLDAEHKGGSDDAAEGLHVDSPV